MFSDESRTLGITIMAVFFRRVGVLCGLRINASPVGSRAVPPVTWLELRRITLPATSARLLPSSPREASPDLHGRFKCCPDSHSTSAFLSTCLAMLCTSATFEGSKFTATAFPSPSHPCHFLCTFHFPSLAFLPHLPLPPQISICNPDCLVPILKPYLAHLQASRNGQPYEM
jgi:hypothetical protein